MPQNGQAEVVASGPHWPWRRLMAGASAVLAFLQCAAFVNSTWDALKPPPGYGFYDPPSPPSLAGYLIFALLLSGVVAWLWNGRTWILMLGWLAVLGAVLIDLGLAWGAHPEIPTQEALFWTMLKVPYLLFLLAGLGLAMTGRTSRITAA